MLAAALVLAGSAAAAEDQTAWVYSPDHVSEINLTMSPAAQKALKAKPDDYVKATFALTGDGAPSVHPLVVGVKLKGHASFRSLAHKAAFKIKFGEFVDGQTYLGLKTMVLNNMVQDATMVHEVLAYESFRAAGLPAWRTGYSFVRINGQAYGVYLNLESPDAVALARSYRTTDHLYEGGQGIDLVPGDAAKFSVEEGDEEDIKDIRALIAAVKTWKNVDKVADLAEMTRFFAVEKYIGHWDGYAGRSRPNNFYLHSDAKGRFSLLPWGTDQTFERALGYGDPGGVLFRQCLANAQCKALYRRTADDVRTTLGGLDLAGLATRTAAMLAPWQALDPRRESTDADAAAGLAALQQFLAARRTDTKWQTTANARVTLHAKAFGGGRVRFTGLAIPRHDGAIVKIQRQAGVGFKTIARATLVKASETSSGFAVTVRGVHSGRYRVYLAADADHLPATAYLRLRVKER